MYCLQKMPIDKYAAVTKLMAWNKLELINQLIDKILDSLKEESLSPKYDITQYAQTIKSIQDLQFTVESRYVEKTQEELDDEKKMGEILPDIEAKV